MGTLLLIVLIVLLLGGGGGYGWHAWGYPGGPYAGGGLGLIVAIVVILLLFRGGIW